MASYTSRVTPGVPETLASRTTWERVPQTIVRETGAADRFHGAEACGAVEAGPRTAPPAGATVPRARTTADPASGSRVEVSREGAIRGATVS